MSWKRVYGRKLLVQLHPLTYIEITNYFNYEPRFDGAFSRNIAFIEYMLTEKILNC